MTWFSKPLVTGMDTLSLDHTSRRVCVYIEYVPAAKVEESEVGSSNLPLRDEVTA